MKEELYFTAIAVVVWVTLNAWKKVAQVKEKWKAAQKAEEEADAKHEAAMRELSNKVVHDLKELVRVRAGRPKQGKMLRRGEFAKHWKIPVNPN